jgi:hypothetical protein
VALPIESDTGAPGRQRTRRQFPGDDSLGRERGRELDSERPSPMVHRTRLGMGYWTTWWKRCSGDSSVWSVSSA